MIDNYLERRPHFIPAMIATVMLLLALASWPYGYYQLLRFIVCGVAGQIIYLAHNWQKMWAVWGFGLIAILFNPLIPIYLPRAIWQVMDITCSILFICSMFILKSSTDKKEKLT